MANWKLEGVTKDFEDIRAINDITIEIEEKKIYGLIGRNGAGKTTLLKLLANQLDPTTGVIKNAKKILSKNDKLTQDICLARETININGIKTFSVKKILKIASYIYPNWDQEYCQELIGQFELDIRKKYNKLSKGMQTIVGIIIGLASRASLTLFDEPYIGLDPVSRELFYELLIEDYQANPRTVIISTHLINELENLFEKILIIHKGSLIIAEDMEVIKQKAVYISGDREKIAAVIKGKNIIHQQLIGRLANITVLDSFTEKEIMNIRKRNLEYGAVSLQKLLVNLSKGGQING